MRALFVWLLFVGSVVGASPVSAQQRSVSDGPNQVGAALDQVVELVLQTDRDAGRLLSDPSLGFPPSRIAPAFGAFDNIETLRPYLVNGAYLRTVQGFVSQVVAAWERSSRAADERSRKLGELYMLREQQVTLLLLYGRLSSQPMSVDPSGGLGAIDSSEPADRAKELFQEWLTTSRTTEDEAALKALFDGLSVLTSAQRLDLIRLLSDSHPVPAPLDPIAPVPPPFRVSGLSSDALASRVNLLGVGGPPPLLADPDELSDVAAVIIRTDASRAADLLRQALTKSPDNPQIAYNYAVALYESGRQDEALAQAEVAMRRHPSLDEPRLLAATIKISKGALEEATEILRTVTSVESAVARAIQALLAVKSGRLREAVELFETLLRVDPTNTVFAYDAGVAHQLDRNIEAAEALYRRAVGQNPDFAEAHFNLATVLGWRGDPKFVYEFREALRLSPSLSGNIAAYVEKQAGPALNPVESVRLGAPSPSGGAQPSAVGQGFTVTGGLVENGTRGRDGERSPVIAASSALTAAQRGAQQKSRFNWETLATALTLTSQVVQTFQAVKSLSSSPSSSASPVQADRAQTCPWSDEEVALWHLLDEVSRSGVGNGPSAPKPIGCR